MSKSDSPREDAQTAVSTDTDSNTAESDTLSKDEMFELLKNRRRRDALRYLLEADGESTLSDLAERIAAKENDIEIRELSSAQRKRVYIGLYQCHLPKLADAGVVDFEKHRGDVERLDAADQLDPYLDVPTSEDTDETDAADTAGDTDPGADAEHDERSPHDAEFGPAPASLPSSFDHRDDQSTHRLLASVTGLAALAGLVGVPGLRRVPETVWALLGAAVGFVASRE